MLEISQNFETSKCFVMNNVRTMKDLDLPTQKIDVENLVQYIKKAKLKGLNGIKPFILVGQDNCSLILVKEVIQRNQHHPVLSKTELG
jgi:hypothetical protein